MTKYFSTFQSLLPTSLCCLFAAVSPALAQCPAGDYKLPNSGLCASEAAKLMPPANEDYALGLDMFQCKAVIHDVNMFGDIVLYRAADCGKGPVVLEAGMGAHSGSLSVISGGLKVPGTDPYDLIKIIHTDPGNPTSALERWARQGMEGEGGYDAGYMAKCKARKVPGTKDFWVVDIYDNNNIPTSEDGPRIECGPYGYLGDSNAAWRVAFGMTMYADFGQDAYQDVDFASLTKISKQTGQWVPVGPNGSQSSSAAPAPTPAPSKSAARLQSSSGITNISGATETPYGGTRGWVIYSAHQDGQLHYCVGERDFSGVKLRLGFDGGQWQFAIPFAQDPGYSSQFDVDGKARYMSGTSDGQWTYHWLNMADLELIKNGNLLAVEIGRSSIDYPLIGTAATILKVKECVDMGR